MSEVPALHGAPPPPGSPNSLAQLAKETGEDPGAIQRRWTPEAALLVVHLLRELTGNKLTGRQTDRQRRRQNRQSPSDEADWQTGEVTGSVAENSNRPAMTAEQNAKQK